MCASCAPAASFSAGRNRRRATLEQAMMPNWTAAMILFGVAGVLVLKFVERALGIAMIAVAHAEVLVDDGFFAVIPALGQEGNRLAVGDGQKHMIRFARNVDALALVHVDERFLAAFDVHFHLHA